MAKKLTSGFSPGYLVAFPLDPKTIPRRKWLVPAVIPKGEPVMLVGPPKMAKSALTLQLALAILCGSAMPLFRTNEGAPWRFARGVS